ncbi:MAG: isoprenyl transferase [Syntrophomonadaceae bacterium]|jgi:undecaprenyl diphosphate synthase
MRENNINIAKLPRHIAIIMDGNGRWARKRLLPRTAGHRAGMSSLKGVVQTCAEIGIPVLTVYAFSTENWKRPVEEVNYLMKLLVEYMHKELDELHENNIRINILGDYKSLPHECQIVVKEAMRTTSKNTGMILNIALNYGSRREILEAVNHLVKQAADGLLPAGEITEEDFSQLLSTKDLPDPDLVIRTAGEMRLSNFLLWQIAYAELWITDCMWPEFSKEELMKALNDYQNRDRRFGGISRKKMEQDINGMSN